MSMEVLFWMALFGVCYAYFGYPLLLLALPRVPSARREPEVAPSVSIVIPAHNEAAVIARKLENTLALRYPSERREIILVSDGSTDATARIARRYAGVRVLELDGRGGKARALNAALELAGGDLIVFSDASIMLEPDALQAIVAPFADPTVGCVSGEDKIEGGGGEGAYGRYELFLRNLESRVASIVGASGCFYAQRRALCEPFAEGMAPDFLSVLNTVERGYRAVSEPRAVGFMRSVKSPREEFARKVRTFLRGMSALAAKKHLLNPLRHGRFAVVLASHKLVRWCVPLFLVLTLVSNAFLLDQPLYLALFLGQTAFYLLAALAYFEAGGVQRLLLAKIPLYFTAVNIAIACAWLGFLRGVRQEIWDPSKRAA